MTNLPISIFILTPLDSFKTTFNKSALSFSFPTNYFLHFFYKCNLIDAS